MLPTLPPAALWAPAVVAAAAVPAASSKRRVRKRAIQQRVPICPRADRLAARLRREQEWKERKERKELDRQDQKDKNDQDQQHQDEQHPPRSQVLRCDRWATACEHRNPTGLTVLVKHRRPVATNARASGGNARRQLEKK
jgi:hypothetical protein